MSSTHDLHSQQYEDDEVSFNSHDSEQGKADKGVKFETEKFRLLLKAASAELIGSAFMLFFGVGAGMTTIRWQFTGSITIGVALNAAFTVFCIVYSIGHISGGHLNCAVTTTLALLKRITMMRAVLYIIAQFIGGLIGIGCLKLITPRQWWLSCFGANLIKSDVSVSFAFLTELLLTFFIMLVTMAACDSGKSNQTLVPFVIGTSMFCAHMIALPIDGCSLNPMRTFVSSVAASGVEGCEYAWDNHWVFWCGPLLGAISAGLLYDRCFHTGSSSKIDRLIDQYRNKKAG